MDHAHNAAALGSLIAAFGRYPSKERLDVLTVTGSRRDADIVRQGDVLGVGFDSVLLYEDQVNCGRPDGEVIDRLTRDLALRSRVREIDEIRGERTASASALGQLEFAFVNASARYPRKSLDPGNALF